MIRSCAFTGLTAAALAFGLVQGVQAQGTDMPMTGAQIGHSINDALARNGQSGSAIIAAERRYYPCGEPLTISPRHDGRWDAVDVTCTQPLAWSIVVRTSADATASETDGAGDGPAMKSAVVLKHSVRKGEVLTAKLLTVMEFETALAPGIYTNPNDLVGRRMSQGLGAGVPIRGRHLQLDWAVTDGGAVSIEINTGGLTVSTVGQALENGQIGDSVLIRNSHSGKTLRGVVTGEKKVSIGANIN